MLAEHKPRFVPNSAETSEKNKRTKRGSTRPMTMMADGLIRDESTRRGHPAAGTTPTTPTTSGIPNRLSIRIDPSRCWYADSELHGEVVFPRPECPSLPQRCTWTSLSIVVKGAELSTICLMLHGQHQTDQTNVVRESDVFLLREVCIVPTFGNEHKTHDDTYEGVGVRIPFRLPPLESFLSEGQHTIPSFRCDGSESNGNYSHCAVRYSLTAQLAYSVGGTSRSVYSDETEIHVLPEGQNPGSHDQDDNVMLSTNEISATPWSTRCWVVAPLRFQWLGLVHLRVVDYPTTIRLRREQTGTLGHADVALQVQNESNATIGHVVVRLIERVRWKTSGRIAGCDRVLAEACVHRPDLPVEFQPSESRWLGGFEGRDGNGVYNPQKELITHKSPEPKESILRIRLVVPSGSLYTFESGVYASVTHSIHIRAVVPSLTFVTNPETTIPIQIRSGGSNRDFHGPTDVVQGLPQSSTPNIQSTIGYKPPASTATSTTTAGATSTPTMPETPPYPEELMSFSSGSIYQCCFY